jgi:hypothetical protein
MGEKPHAPMHATGEIKPISIRNVVCMTIKCRASRHILHQNACRLELVHKHAELIGAEFEALRRRGGRIRGQRLTRVQPKPHGWFVQVARDTAAHHLIHAPFDALETRQLRGGHTGTGECWLVREMIKRRGSRSCAWGH